MGFRVFLREFRAESMLFLAPSFRKCKKSANFSQIPASMTKNYRKASNYIVRYHLWRLQGTLFSSIFRRKSDRHTLRLHGVTLSLACEPTFSPIYRSLAIFGGFKMRNAGGDKPFSTPVLLREMGLKTHVDDDPKTKVSGLFRVGLVGFLGRIGLPCRSSRRLPCGSSRPSRRLPCRLSWRLPCKLSRPSGRLPCRLFRRLFCRPCRPSRCLPCRRSRPSRCLSFRPSRRLL